MNEEGTEAAAYTGMLCGGGAYIPKEPPKFIADHPFAYMLMLNNGKGSTMLFNGTYSG
jgi:serine protease inhibitor